VLNGWIRGHVGFRVYRREGACHSGSGSLGVIGECLVCVARRWGMFHCKVLVINTQH
jgi:hypothetical protein